MRESLRSTRREGGGLPFMFCFISFWFFLNVSCRTGGSPRRPWPGGSACRGVRLGGSPSAHPLIFFFYYYFYNFFLTGYFSHEATGNPAAPSLAVPAVISHFPGKQAEITHTVISCTVLPDKRKR